MSTKSKIKRRKVTVKSKPAPVRAAVIRRRSVSSKIDAGAVAGKYIGETEKNLKKVFAVAGRSGGALLLDEGDALLGKRSEVKDAHDRYANVEMTMSKRTSRRKKDA